MEKGFARPLIQILKLIKTPSNPRLEKECGWIHCVGDIKAGDLCELTDYLVEELWQKKKWTHKDYMQFCDTVMPKKNAGSEDEKEPGKKSEKLLPRAPKCNIVDLENESPSIRNKFLETSIKDTEAFR